MLLQSCLGLYQPILKINVSQILRDILDQKYGIYLVQYDLEVKSLCLHSDGIDLSTLPDFLSQTLFLYSEALLQHAFCFYLKSVTWVTNYVLFLLVMCLI